jgi:hypothetical protein
MPAGLLRSVMALDEFAIRTRQTTTGFAQIAHYKGLESEVVILVRAG